MDLLCLQDAKSVRIQLLFSLGSKVKFAASKPTQILIALDEYEALVTYRTFMKNRVVFCLGSAGGTTQEHIVRLEWTMPEDSSC